MFAVLFFAALLVAITVAVHSAGLGILLSHLMKSHELPPTQPWPITFLLIRLTWLLILIHVAEVCVWGSFFLWERCLPDAESAFYFSGVTYTTIGYGDLVLPEPWRLLGPVEGMTGILMCGLSAGLFFAMVVRIYAPRLKEKQN
jgi:hypothetical protein